MGTELEQLRRRSDDVGTAESLGGDEALEVNAAILDLAPGDPRATNRLGIGLIKNGRFDEALAVLEAGLRVHPDNEIMRRRRDEAARQIASAGRTADRRRGGSGPRSGVPVVGWTDFDPGELVESSLAGPGRDACIRFCADSIRASERIDAERTAVTPVKVGRRFRVIGGIFTGVAPWGATLSIAVPVARRAVIASAVELGGQELEPANAVPSVEVALPRDQVGTLYEELLSAHTEHLRNSIAVGPPTHLNKHSPAVRRYILDQANRLAGGS